MGNPNLRLRSIGGFLAAMLCFLFAAPVPAATYYLSPGGKDSDAGTDSDHPWKTWNRAFPTGKPQLHPGDTLVLLDGTYTKLGSGFLSANCGGSRPNAMNGTSAAHIRIVAQNERRARLEGDGWADTFRLTSCSFYEVIGLVSESGDAKGKTSGGQPFRFTSKDNDPTRGIVFRRNIARHNNRYSNSHLVSFEHVDDVLAEENEFYEFHRHAILIFYSNNGIYRRNYANSRGWADLPDGRESGYPKTGDDAITIYPGSNNLLENNISEGNGNLTSIQATADSKNNRLFGNVSLNDNYGFLAKARGDTPEQMPVNTLVRDLVVAGSSQAGFYARATRGTVCDHCTVMPRSGPAFDADANPRGGRGGGRYDVQITNSFAKPIGSASYGFLIVDQADWRLERVWAVGAGTSFRPGADDPHVKDSRSADPGNGACRLWLPDGAAGKSAASDGGDIGATVLYKYQNGVLTKDPLWDPKTAAFLGAGAIVPGLNDVPGASLFDIADRLNVNRNGCPFPAGYAGSSASSGR